VRATAGEVIEQLFGAFISWHTCTLKSRRRIASPEIRTKRMSIFKLQHGMAGHKMVLRRSNMRKRMSALGQLRLVRLMSALPPKADMVQHRCNVRYVPKGDTPRVWVGGAG
jgi:hypothetical protein